MKGKSRPQTLKSGNESCSGMNLGVAGSNPAGRAIFSGLIFVLLQSDAIKIIIIREWNLVFQTKFPLVIELNIAYQANNTVGFFQETLLEL